MSRELYFVPILTKALAEPDVKRSLENAFASIQLLGHQKRYAEGYHNFCKFMSESYWRRQLLNEQAIRMVILKCAEGTSAEMRGWEELAPIEKGQVLRFRNEHEALCQEFGRFATGARAPVVQVLCNGRKLGQVSFSTKAGRRTLDGINPGHYSLKLDSGLVIWEGQLYARDLIWTEAFGGKNLNLAAETSDIRRLPAREVEVPEAALTLRTFAGLETGSLEIELTP